ncbi:MAG: DUF6279 family lipoprotein [Caldimonas sp.]|nr:DUF6279 family lipoprotein [Pseudomonadota bacterium]
MITTFNTMPPPVLRRVRFRLPIIAALLIVIATLCGCGVALKLGYDQGSPLAFRWLDGYVDFNDAQSLRVRGALDEWFAWHRRTQLPDYADLLVRAEAEVLANTTPERMCAWAGEIRRRVDVAFEHARPTVAEVLPTLTPQQIANVEKKYAERNENWRDDYLQRDPARRREAAVDREVERAEKLYGSLDDAQRDSVQKWVADSPFDAELSYTERLRRQHDVTAVLRRLGGSGATRADADTEIGAYLQRLDRSPNEDYRRYAVRLSDYNCAFAATLHNATSPAQRRAAQQRLKGYERDLSSLAADAPK